MLTQDLNAAAHQCVINQRITIRLRRIQPDATLRRTIRSTMHQPLKNIAQIRAAIVVREKASEVIAGEQVRALAIRDLVANKPLVWTALPHMPVPAKYLTHCLTAGDVVLPSRGDYYKAWLFEGADEMVFPVGQVNVVRPARHLDARYLVWYLNQPTGQQQIRAALTGSNVKALTTASLSALSIDLPALPTQRRIAELDHVGQRLAAIRHRLNELDAAEIASRTQQILREGHAHA